MYAQTRLAHLNLKAKAAGETQIKFEQLTKDTTIELGPAQTVEIQGKYALDYNGDGIIGVGDVALANAADKVAAANAAEIKPYKHVVVLTTDGGGNPGIRRECTMHKVRSKELRLPYGQPTQKS